MLPRQLGTPLQLRDLLATALAFVSLACAALLAPAAHADAFVEPNGAPRLASAPGDPRYKLVLKAPRDYKLGAAAGSGTVPNSADYRLRPPWGPVDPYENPRLAGKPYHAHVIRAAREHAVDPALVYAVIAAESNFDPKAVSRRGAIGLMQVMPGTGRRYGRADKELYAPVENIGVGVRYLADLLALFDGDVELALAGYNAGENVVIRHGRKVPPYAETRAYVPRVLRAYERLAPRRAGGYGRPRRNPAAGPSPPRPGSCRTRKASDRSP